MKNIKTVGKNIFETKLQFLTFTLDMLTIGRMNLSYFGGFRVNPSPTNVTLVTIRFQAFSVKKGKSYAIIKKHFFNL